MLRRWFPERTFVLAADGGFASHDLAEYAGRQQQRLSLVSRFYPAAALYELPPVVVLDAKGKRGGSGRPRVKGAKRDTPEQAVAKAKAMTRLRVSWYGGGERDVEVVTGTGHWYKGCVHRFGHSRATHFSQGVWFESGVPSSSTTVPSMECGENRRFVFLCQAEI